MKTSQRPTINWSGMRVNIHTHLHHGPHKESFFLSSKLRNDKTVRIKYGTNIKESFEKEMPLLVSPYPAISLVLLVFLWYGGLLLYACCLQSGACASHMIVQRPSPQDVKVGRVAVVAGYLLHGSVVLCT